MQTTDEVLQPILGAMREGIPLVTVNNRLARHGRATFTRHAATTGSVWPAPDILPWSRWLRRLWAEASWLDQEAPLLLTAEQAAQIWQDIVKEDAPPLLQVSSAAKLAQEAWDLVQGWCLSLPFDPLECNDDVLHFQRWAGRFAHECEKQGWLDEASLPARLIKALQARRITPPARILLLGFEDWTPVQKALLDALEQHGTQVECLAGPSMERGAGPSPKAQAAAQLALMLEGAPRRGRISLPDAASEDEAAARWARAHLERNPSARLAIIAPDLGKRLSRLSRVLDAQLAPQALLPGMSDTPRPWNISLGAPLIEHGMVRAAFLVFTLGDARLELDTLGQALRSPFLGGFEQERDVRALLDARLRRQGERRVSLEYMRRQAAAGGCPQFEQILARLHEHQQRQPEQQSPAAWATTLREALRLAGWPGDAALDSPSFQLRQAWFETLDALARLEIVRPHMTRGEALTQLRKFAVETLFQPEAAQEARVQVLGPLEAVGLAFDAIWLLGMHHEQWPPEARPNPFLPMRLQARHGLPHASPERELDYLKRISARLLMLAPEVIVSHPRQDEGRELEPSPLFDHLPEMDGWPELSNLPLPERWGESAPLEYLVDHQAPTLAQGEEAPGGARLLELQSACPFRAFAELRLRAQPLEEPDLGPDARVRGVLLHALLERVWGELKDQAKLRALDEASLAARVRDHAHAVVAEEARRRRNLWPERLQCLEIERLTALALEWLAHERERAPFTVEEREQARTIEIADLRLKVKLDRVDRLADGGRMIIDYKTGPASPTDWAGERPVAPQLPFYAVSEKDVRAIAFAQVRAGEVRLKGQGDGVEGLKPAEPDWMAQLAAWRKVLTQLAEDFRAGQAMVDPRAPNVCTTCSLGMLCRIHEVAGESHTLLKEGNND